MKEMVRVAIEKYGKLDILHNNAGVVVVEELTTTTEETWDRVMNVNLKGIFLGSKYAIPHMAKTGGGVIINTASSYGLIGYSGHTAYCASKGGVINLTRAMALECAPFNIRVNCICPTSVSTPMLEREIAMSPEPEKAREVWQQAIPLGRFAQASEIAKVVLFLASDESSFITGSAILVDGGETAQ
jgi:NAD(P)-dependent dehydrogenase (short-subunit alcohol dehydrogenase family)